MPEAHKPSEPKESPYLRGAPFEPLMFEAFQGVNTSTTRPGVPDKQAYWLDGFFPLDQRNLRTLYGVGTTLYTAVGKTVVFFDFANLGSTPIMIVFLSDGSVVQVNTSSGAVVTILPAASITSPSILNCGISAWGNQYVIIVANQTNGYWVWDGATLYTAGGLSPVITVTDPGNGYSSAPTVAITGGTGHGASAVAFVSGGYLTSISLTNAGVGYLATDTLSVVLTGGTTTGSGATLVGIVSSGTVSSISIVTGGSGYSPHPSITFAGPVNTRATGAVFVAASPGPITSATISWPGTGYTTATVAVTITDTASVGSASVTLMPYAVQGTAVETYAGHVWVANVAAIYYSAPGSFSDFSTNNGGGNFTSHDSFLRVGFIQLVQTNGFLYLIADSSINYISGVQTSGSPPTTTFTNQNADPQVGTPYPASVEVQGQNILFANSFGIHVLNGARATKISKALDGVYNTVANFGGIQLSATQAIIFGRKVWMVLVRIVDPVSGSTVNKLLMWDGANWFASEQDLTLSYVKHQEINSIITAWGTNGTVIRPLFNTASNGFTKTAQSKLWDTPGGYQFTKSMAHFWSMSQYYSTVSPNYSVIFDKEIPSAAATVTITGPSSISNLFISPPQMVGQWGFLNGVTIKTNSADMALISAMLGPGDVTGYAG